METGTTLSGTLNILIAKFQSGHNRGGSKVVSRKYDAMVCKTCRREQQPSSMPLKPGVAYSIVGNTFLIPYTIQVILGQADYSHDEIQNLVSSLSNEIKTIREKYIERGGEKIYAKITK